MEKIRGSKSSSSVGLMTGRYSIDTKVTCGYKGCKKFLKYYFSAYWGEESLKEEQLWRLGLVASPHQGVHTSRKPGNLGFGIHTLDQVFYIITYTCNNQTHSLPLKGKIATLAPPVEYCFQLQMPPFGTEEETFIKKDLKHSTNGKG